VSDGEQGAKVTLIHEKLGRVTGLAVQNGRFFWSTKGGDVKVGPAPNNGEDD